MEGFDDSYSVYKKTDILNSIVRLSYIREIKRWLEDCTNPDSIKSQRVLFTILQYIDIIRNI